MAMQEPRQPLLLESNARDIDVKRSFSLVQQFSRWLLSAVCVASLLASFKVYQVKGNLTSTQVTNFNAISTALALALGLCFFVSRPVEISPHRPRSLTDRLIGRIPRSRKGFEMENIGKERLE
jgi:hypothetical protein